MIIKIVNGIKVIKDKHSSIKKDLRNNITNKREYEAILSSYKTSNADIQLKEEAIYRLERDYPQFSKKDFSIANQVNYDITEQYYDC